MDPKELAAYLKKKQDEAASKGDATARWEKGQREELQERTEKGKSALKNSVIPYLRRVQAAMPQGQFSLSPSGDGVNSPRPWRFLLFNRGSFRQCPDKKDSS